MRRWSLSVTENSGNVLIGLDYAKWHQEQQQVPVQWREHAISNCHIGVAGTSGSGKTHWIREFAAAMPDYVEIDIFDYHDDIVVPGAVDVLYSESTRYGYNPLVLNTDEHYGGLRRCINDIIETINSTSRKLGEAQENVLRKLITDVFALRGITADNPRSWAKREATDQEIAEMQQRRDWTGLNACYPTLNDVISFANRKLKALWLGIEDKGDGKHALAAFDEYTRAVGVLSRLRSNHAKTVDHDEKAEIEQKMFGAKDKASSTYTTFLANMETGREFDEMKKYHSKDTLLSVISRLENLLATGLFSPRKPPFGDARIRRHRIKPLAQSEDELKMFVRFRTRAMIRELMQNGESPGGRLRRLLILDESKKFNDEEASNPLNVYVNEMRKFGGGLLLAGQSPAHFSADFIKNAGTLLLLNLATDDWDAAARKLKIDAKALKFLMPRSTAAVRMLEVGKQPAFQAVQLIDTSRRQATEAA
jgi:hypothetical protein